MSPAATIDDDEATRAILQAADALFYARGIAAVTMSDVRDRSGVSMRRLYALHPSKGDLVAAWLTERHRTWMNWFTVTVDRHIAAGTDSLLATFDALREWISSPGYRGCAFVNAIAETAEIDDRHRTIIAEHKRDLLAHLTALATRDHLGAPDWLVPALGVLLDGALVQCAVFGDDRPLVAARAAAHHLLETIRT